MFSASLHLKKGSLHLLIAQPDSSPIHCLRVSLHENYYIWKSNSKQSLHLEIKFKRMITPKNQIQKNKQNQNNLHYWIGLDHLEIREGLKKEDMVLTYTPAPP